MFASKTIALNKMDKKMKFEVGDTVRVFTVDEVKAYVEDGGEDYSLLEREEECHNTAFGKVRKIAKVDNDGDIELECEGGEGDYWYPFQICELVEEGGNFNKFNIQEVETGEVIRVNEDGFGIEFKWNIYCFMITPSGKVVVWNDYQDYFVEDSESKFKVIFN